MTRAFNLTPLRRKALEEIEAAGDVGLGFGVSPLGTRRDLLKAGLTERLPHKGGLFAPIREVLTASGATALARARGEQS